MATSVKIDQELKNRIQRLAERRQRTSHWIMHEAIKVYVQREEAREDFKQEALASWQSYQETGLHLNSEEVQDWLNSWGSDDEQAMPQCHE